MTRMSEITIGKVRQIFDGPLVFDVERSENALRFLENTAHLPTDTVVVISIADGQMDATFKVKDAD